MNKVQTRDPLGGKGRPQQNGPERSLSREGSLGSPDPLRWIATVGIVIASGAWCYWSTILSLMRDWRNDENYSVGQLVPLVAVYLAWHDRARLKDTIVKPCWWGLGIVILAQFARLFGLLFLFESAERYALVLTIVGVVLLLLGRTIFWRLRWVLLFLFLMVPLPGRVHNAISGPLQNAATTGAVFCLEVLGVAVTREGNVMVLNDSVQVAVAEACSGLRMLTAFVVVAAVFAYVLSRTRWQSALLVFSSVPVAIFCNLLRLVVTSILFLWVSGDFAQRFFHDFAGWAMMPAAIALLAIILWVSSRMILEDSPAGEKRAGAPGHPP